MGSRELLTGGAHHKIWINLGFDPQHQNKEEKEEEEEKKIKYERFQAFIGHITTWQYGQKRDRLISFCILFSAWLVLPFLS